MGLAGGTALATVEEVREGGDSPTRPGSMGCGSSCDGGRPHRRSRMHGTEAPNLKELGPVVPPRPAPDRLSAAGNDRTNRSWGALYAGIGAASKQQAEDRMGLAWIGRFRLRAISLTAFSRCWRARRRTWSANTTTRAQLDIAGPATPPSSSPPLAHACCGFAGERVERMTFGQCGTSHDRNPARVAAGAEAAGRGLPRVMALVRVCVTEDRSGAFALAKTISPVTRQFRSCKGP